jgi:hypothetical protein
MKRLLVLMIFVALAAPVAAQDDPGAADHQRRNPFNMMVRFLELDEVQAEEWKALIEQSRSDAAALEEEARAIQQAIADEFETGAPDAQTVGELVIERRAVAEELGDVHRLYLETFRNEILTEDQNRKVSFLRHAERAQPFVMAAKRLGLLPKPPRPGGDGDPNGGETEADRIAPLPSLF